MSKKQRRNAPPPDETSETPAADETSETPAADETSETTVEDVDVDETADTEAPPPTPPTMGRTRKPDPVDRRLATRPTPYEKAQAWAEASAKENARQIADKRAADVREGERLLALSRGEPWPPPEPAA